MLYEIIILIHREVWPEDGIFGEVGIQTDEELTMLETIYNTDMGVDLTGAWVNYVKSTML